MSGVKVKTLIQLTGVEIPALLFLANPNIRRIFPPCTLAAVFFWHQEGLGIVLLQKAFLKH